MSLYERYWDALINGVNSLPNQRIFYVRDAFGIERWKDVKEAGFDKKLGENYYNAVLNGKFENVDVISKDEQGVQRYQIKK